MERMHGIRAVRGDAQGSEGQRERMCVHRWWLIMEGR